MCDPVIKVVIPVFVSVESSVGNGGSGAFLRNALEPKAIPCTTFPLNGKLNGNNHWK